MSASSAAISNWRLCVAPMMDWTDRHCRFFHRQLAPSALLYTEMVTAQAIMHGDRRKLLDYNDCEHPVALQLGGSDPVMLAQAAKIGRQWEYDEINLNCGCPSDRVQNGQFGACLMAMPATVADCVKAMRDAVDCPVTVKTRLGIDAHDSYEFVRDFVGQVAEAGCEVFIMHARKAWLKGLSPRENREKPPLQYDKVYQLKRDFPQLTIVVNGGLEDVAACEAALGQGLDGVMLGRAAYHNPMILAELEAALFGGSASPLEGEVSCAAGRRGVNMGHIDTPHQHSLNSPGTNPGLLRECNLPLKGGGRNLEQTALANYRAYMAAQVSNGIPLNAMTRHILGMFAGQRGARRYRQILTEEASRHPADITVLDRALMEFDE